MKYQTILGENKAIAALTFEADGANQFQLGALVHLPTSFDPNTNKTYYKQVGVSVPITDAQRIAIIAMLGGTYVRPDTTQEREAGTIDRKVQTPVEASDHDAGSRRPSRADEKSRT
jgi:hypothetical protein